MILATSIFAGSLVAAALMLAGLRPILASEALKRRNYAGRDVFTAAGLLLAPVYALAFVVSVIAARPENVSSAPQALLVLVLGFTVLGLLDDLLGGDGARGFKGHLKSLFKGRVTTGMLKAGGGILLALAASAFLKTHVWEVLLDGAIIALAANLFNELDASPGRSTKIFVPASVALVAVLWNSGTGYSAYAPAVLAGALVLLPGDLGEKRMLGDTGSNTLGATIGLGLALLPSAWWRLGFMVFLLAANVLLDRFSLSTLIERNRVLSWLDSLGRKGEKVAAANYN